MSAEVPNVEEPGAEEHHADENYDVELEEANDGAWRKVGRWVIGIFDAALGGDGSEAAGATAVVRRISDDKEILRITAGNYDEAESLLALLRNDLENMSQEEFLREWGARDDTEVIDPDA